MDNIIGQTGLNTKEILKMGWDKGKVFGNK
jgi:hypothetical protein